MVTPRAWRMARSTEKTTAWRVWIEHACSLWIGCPQNKLRCPCNGLCCPHEGRCAVHTTCCAVHTTCCAAHTVRQGWLEIRGKGRMWLGKQGGGGSRAGGERGSA
eukprot:185328-Chlamydomonas_euryale.AAC.1